jgi:hypothetical protein
MILTVKYFFLADFIVWGVILDLAKHIFPWQTCLFGGYLQLELSCVQVNKVQQIWKLKFLKHLEDEHYHTTSKTED